MIRHGFPLGGFLPRPRHPRRFGAIVFAALLLSVIVSLPGVSGAVRAKAAPTLPQTALTLDGVTLSIQSAFLPTKFVTAPADNMTQLASAVEQHPYREFQIEAIPFHTTASLEGLPVAESGGAQAYRSVLHAFRVAHGGQTIAHPTITVFGQRVTGEANLVQLYLDSAHLQSAVMTEYVVEAGPRLWLIRLTQELTSNQHASLRTAAQPFLSSQASVTISSSTLNSPSTHVAALLQDLLTHPASSGVKGAGAFYSPLTGQGMRVTTESGFASQLAELFHASPADPLKANTLTVGWWNGTCDYYNYLHATGWQSWQMNSGLNGVYPCGPRPDYGGPDHNVQFYPGAWGALEWECVELSLRWMYLAYGVSPYPANGNTIVSNYNSAADGGHLTYEANNTNCCVVPVVGSILSYCSTCTHGHTSVVMSTNINSSGNGSITVMEQNVGTSGMETLTVHSWEILDTPQDWVYAYLNPPNPCPRCS